MSTKGKSCEKVADRVMRASAAAIPRLMCPLCGGPLSIQYTDLNNPGRRKRRALSVMCKRCVWRVISDGLPY